MTRTQAEQKAQEISKRDGVVQHVPSKVMAPPYEDRIHRMAPGPERTKLRSVTYQGVADAMGFQWGAPHWK